MNRRPGKSTRSRRSRRLWAHEQAAAAIPFIRSVLQSAREHWLESLSYDRRAKQLADRPGRPNRASLIAQEEARRAALRHQRLFDETIDDLDRIGVQCVDPVNGLAVIPFLHEEKPAWLLFDLHAEQPLTAWRYHDDPVETVRNLDELTSRRPSPFFAR